MKARGTTRRLGLFGASVLLNGVVSLVTIPVVVAMAGADPWASMATGQSIGNSIGVLVTFGWGLTGPATIAMASIEKRPGLFLDSLFSRGALLLPLLLLQALVTAAIVPNDKIVAFVAGLAMTLAGVSANWYFAGESRPGRFLLFDTIPRVLGTVAGLLLVVLTDELLFFALAQLAGSLLALGVSSYVIFRGRSLDFREAARWRNIVARLVEQRHGVVATGLQAAATPAILGIVAITALPSLPLFVLADRLSKFVGMATSPLIQVFQGWVPAARGVELRRRIAVSARITVILTVVAGATYAALLPLFSQVLTHGQVAVDASSAIAFGIVASSWVLSPYLTNVALMAVGRVRVVAFGAALGVPLTLILLTSSELLGATEFAPWSIVIGNTVGMTWLVVALRKALQGPLEPALNFVPDLEPVP
ncbi:MAG: hypothetical protein KF761_12955 [Salinibacterium sp.]|nr:hypothetical protein [Salinibacterium sp.]